MTFVEHQAPMREQSIPERFEEMVARFPDRLAIKCAGRSFSYKELDRASNRIARSLLTVENLGSGSVALLFDHGVNVIVAMMGALKAGKQVCVLDSRAPEVRMKFIIDDCRISAILTDTGWCDLAQKVFCNYRNVLNVDEIDQTISPAELGLPIAPSHTAFIAYTSGSTGQPRGVSRTHQERVARAISSGRSRNLCGDDRLSLLHSVAFGSGGADLFMALLNGVAVLPFDIASEGILNLVQWLKRERITVFHAPPAVFRELENVEYSPDHFRDLRLIRLSGAPITERDFELYKKKFTRGTLLEIGMGSTEVEAISNAVVNHDFPFPKEGSPVGYAREGKEVLIVNDEGQELGPGEVGEIVIRSRQFTKGYLRRLGLPGEKLHRDPKDENALIFWTGDLGARLADGFVIHRGRKDLMVKIRGFRVDISEVEHALLEHPGIKDAGVRAWDREEGEKSLAGYIVPRLESVLNASEVREFLSNKLPDYMIPTAFKFVESLPLTNGKLDRLALPKPDPRRPELKETYVAPRNDVERKLAGIWSEVLQIDDIGIQDNFFDLGGHSLTASRVLSRVLDCFRVEVSLRSFFESGTIADLSADVKNAIRQQHSSANLPLVPIPRASNLPVSFGQRALWLHDQLEPGSCAYNLVSSYQLSGELDAPLLEKSMNQIIARHEVLRTVFETVDGQPVQKILPTMMIGLEPIDLTHLASEALQGSEVRRLVGVFAERSFDLARGPLLRSSLLKLDRNEHVLVVAIHHIVFDGWSIGVFVRELFQIYNNLRSGKPCPLLELSIQYADFAKWQREHLHGAKLRKSLDYWKAKLADLPALTLPTKRAKKISGRGSGGREEFEVSRELLDGLRGLANRSGTTLFMVLLAAWKITLCRYTGQTDIAIGTPVAGRSHPAVEELIGYFLNLVVLRTDLSGDPTVRELLERMRRVCVDAFAHQEVPFEKLVEELRPTRHVAANPLVQATFALQNTPKNLLNLAGITASDLDISAGILRPFDLHLYIIEEETHLRAFASYNKSWFETETIKRLINHFSNILKAMAVDQDQCISALPMLNEQEKHQLLVGWNGTQVAYPKDKCIHQLFEEQVERMPEAVAVVFDDQQLTYRELNSRANQLAHYLRELGVGPDVLVGLCVERSLEMMVALLGILKAGGAYVPLDSSYPKERLAFILRDAEARVLITQQKFLSSVDHPTVVCLDRDWQEIAQDDAKNPQNQATTENLAYVIYTSGSTGTPKGVMIPHRGLVNYLSWATTAYCVAAGQGAPVHSSIGFDLSITSLFTPLLTARRVVMLPESHSVKTLSSLLRSDTDFSLIKITPAHLEILGQELSGEELAQWGRALVIGGEALTFEKLAVWSKHAPGTRLINEYGPTETVVGCCVYEIAPGTLPSGPVPIGRPIANTQLYILDAQRDPVPIGVAGEIYIGGVGLARGYLNQPELTAEKFIHHSFEGEPVRRLYRTGDLARYLADGNIEFLGRIDNQVKLRGYRIELGEVETVLGQHPMVQSSVVVVREDTPGDKRLVGYVVARSDESFDIQEARKYLKQKLPEYMIPSAFVLLDEMPLTPSGKVDRKALPAPDQDRPELENSYQAPRTPVEEALASIWSELLKVDKVGIHDNFFELGGHSLLATQVISRVRSCFSVEVPLRTLFESPTIEQMGAAIMGHRGEQSGEQELERVLLELEPDEEGAASSGLRANVDERRRSK